MVDVLSPKTLCMRMIIILFTLYRANNGQWHIRQSRDDTGPQVEHGPCEGSGLSRFVTTTFATLSIYHSMSPWTFS